MSNHCKACAGRICTTPTAALYLPGPKPPLTYEDCPGCPECAKKDDELVDRVDRVGQDRDGDWRKEWPMLFAITSHVGVRPTGPSVAN